MNSEFKFVIHIDRGEDIGLAHLCEHLISRKIFTKLGITVTARIFSHFKNDTYVYFTVLIKNTHKLINRHKMKKIINKIRNLVSNFNVSQEEINKESIILQDEIDNKVRGSGKAASALIKYACGYNMFSVFEVPDVTPNCIKRFLKSCRVSVHIEPDEKLIPKHKMYKLYKKYLNIGEQANDINTDYDLNTIIDKELYLTKNVKSKVIIICTSPAPIASHLTLFIANVQCNIRNHYDMLCYDNTICALYSLMLITNDLDFDVNNFKKKVLEHSKKKLDVSDYDTLRSLLNLSGTAYF